MTLPFYRVANVGLGSLAVELKGVSRTLSSPMQGTPQLILTGLYAQAATDCPQARERLDAFRGLLRCSLHLWRPSQLDEVRRMHLCNLHEPLNI